MCRSKNDMAGLKQLFTAVFFSKMKEKSESISFMRKSDTLLTQVVLPGVTMKTRNDVTSGAEGVQVSFFHQGVFVTEY